MSLDTTKKVNSLSGYAKANDINKGILAKCVTLIGYMVEYDKGLLTKQQAESFAESTGNHFPFIDRLNPVSGHNGTFICERIKAPIFSAVELHMSLSEFQSLAEDSLSFLNIVLSITSLAEKISDLEDEQDEAKVIALSKESIDEVCHEVQKAIIHAAHLVTIKSPVIADRSFDKDTVKRKLVRLGLGECELLYALNRSYPNKALYQMINTNRLISDIVSTI